MSKFLVYWTKDHIDNEVKVIGRDLADRGSTKGLFSVFGPISKGIGRLAVTPNVLLSSIPTHAASFVAGRSMYYQHLLSVRNTRDSYGDSDGVVGMAKCVRSYAGNARRLTKDLYGL